MVGGIESRDLRLEETSCNTIHYGSWRTALGSIDLTIIFGAHAKPERNKHSHACLIMKWSQRLSQTLEAC